MYLFVWSAAVIYTKKDALCLLCWFSRSAPQRKKRKANDELFHTSSKKSLFPFLCVSSHRRFFSLLEKTSTPKKRDFDDDNTNKQTLSKISFSSRLCAFDVLGHRPFVPFFRQKAPRSREREREREREDDIIARAVRPVVVVVVPTARKRRAREIDRGSRAESPLFFFFFFDDDDDDDAASATKF
jgi:hypothetical protein